MTDHIEHQDEVIDPKELIMKPLYAGMIVPRIEERIIRLCSDITLPDCEELERRIKKRCDKRVGVSFFSFDGRLILGWGGTAHRSTQWQLVRFSQDDELGGLSRVCRGEVPHESGLFLVRDIGEWHVQANDANSPPLAKAVPDTLGPWLDVAKPARLYLPVYATPDARTPVGAFMLQDDDGGQPVFPLPPSGNVPVSGLGEYVATFNDWQKEGSGKRLARIVHALWRGAWLAARESRTYLPHQGSFRDAVAHVLSQFTEASDVTFGLAHFDFNDFKRFNDRLGYLGADRVVETFSERLMHSLTTWDQLQNWTHPVPLSQAWWSTTPTQKTKPRATWFLSRIGGDEFALLYVGDKSYHQELSNVINEVAAIVEGIHSELQTHALKVRAMGAWFDLHAGEVRTTTTKESNEAAASFFKLVSRTSQMVKSHYKETWKPTFGERFGALELDEVFKVYREKNRLKVKDAETDQDLGLWELPIWEVAECLRYLPARLDLKHRGWLGDRLLMEIQTTGGGAAPISPVSST